MRLPVGSPSMDKGADEMQIPGLKRQKKRNMIVRNNTSQLLWVREASLLGSVVDGPQRRCRRCRSRGFVNLAESAVAGGSNLVLGVWLHQRRDDAGHDGHNGRRRRGLPSGASGGRCAHTAGH